MRCHLPCRHHSDSAAATKSYAELQNYSFENYSFAICRDLEIFNSKVRDAASRGFRPPRRAATRSCRCP